MEQPLTPPPSRRVLRVRHRPRTRTISDENRCSHTASIRPSEGSTMAIRARKELSSSPSRGRTRSRVVRNGLTLNTNHIRPHLSLALPPCCSPPPPLSEAGTTASDEDLIFQMSPIQTQSPTLLSFSAVAHEAHIESNSAKQATMQSLSALWEKHKNNITSAASHTHVPRTPAKRTRADTVTQHQRGFSDTHASVLGRRERRSEHRHVQNAKALLDFSSVLHAPPTPTSPPPAEPFMYSFPSFESSPLVKAREARARRQASKRSMNGEFLTGDSEMDRISCGNDRSLDVEMDNDYSQRLGPIRARKLRIQSGESLSEDMDDANFISHAFQSASLDPEKDNGLGADEDREFDDAYSSSQRSSSVSSSSVTDAASLNQNNPLSSSLLASFPVRPSSRSQTHSNSSSRQPSRRASPTEMNPEASAIAMMTRGRASRRASSETKQATTGCAGGYRRGRGRTPAPARRTGEEVQDPASAARASPR